MKPWEDEDMMRKMYCEEEMTTAEISENLGCSQATVSNWLGNHGIKARDTWETRYIEFLENPKVPVVTEEDGYERILHTYKGKTEKVYLHRLIAVSKCGFSLVDNEEVEVHHKNGIKWDNRPDNIEVVPKQRHQSIHADERMENPDKKYQDKDILQRLYWDEKKSLDEIGREVGCSHKTVAYWMEKHGIERRKSGTASHKENR